MEVNIIQAKGLWFIKLSKGGKEYQPEPQENLIMLQYFIDNFNYFTLGSCRAESPMPESSHG